MGRVALTRGASKRGALKRGALKRGEIWTVAAGSGYGGKPRPAVIVQDARFDAADSVTVCLLTSDPTVAPIFRLIVKPDAVNKLRVDSALLVDKIVTIPRAKTGKCVSGLSPADMTRLDRALLVFLRLAG